MELQTTLRYSGALQKKIIDCDLRSFFMKIADLQQRTTPNVLNRYYASFTELRNELYAYPRHNVSVLELASRLNMSKSYFQHIYKQLFGCSIMQDVISATL